jgi:preprotein translocase subunit YajC
MGSNGNGYYSLIILALPVLLVIWMFWSGSRRQKQLREFNSSLNVGDAVITSSGLYGTIKHLDDESAYLVVAEGMTVRFDRRAIAMKQSDSQSGAAAAGAPAAEQ